MNFISKWLDNTTMYRVVLYVLLAYVVISAIFVATGVMAFMLSELAFTLVALSIPAVVTHYLYAKISGAPANIESTAITVLILYFVTLPTVVPVELASYALISFVVIASKYVLVYRKIHIVNPVALGIVIASVFSIAFGGWWIGSLYMLGPVVIGGWLVTHKIRREVLVSTTLGVSFLTYLGVLAFTEPLSTDAALSFFMASPIIFFVTIMVTEPLSTPPGVRMHILYGSLIGLLVSLPFAIGPFNLGMATALVIANIVFFFVTLRGKVVLTLKEVVEVAKNTYEYVFTPSYTPKFTAGQYFEWTMPHKADRRGIRRYFTVASAPHEKEVRVALKVVTPGSSFKKQVNNMKVGEVIYASSLGGDFVFPKNTEENIVWIAGGIGVTPFVSMTRDLLYKKTKVNVALFYCNNTQADIAYGDLWKTAEEQIGIQTVPVLSHPGDAWEGEQGFVNEAMLAKYVKDATNASYYISGPPGMVNAYKKMLAKMGIKRSQVVTDYFPGLG